MPRVHLPDGRIVNFPDGMSAEDIGKAVEGLGAPHDTPAPNLGRFGGVKMIGDAAIGAGKYAVAHPVASLAALGGLVGSAAAAPAALPALAVAGLGSALGGAGGAGLGSIINAVRGGSEGPSTASGVAKTMASQGATQGLAELTGRGVLQPAASRIARVVMDNAVRPTETLLREFPNVVDTLVSERLPVGRLLGRAGSQQAKAALRTSAGTTRGLLREADAAGAQIQPSQLTAEFPALRADAAKSTGLPGGGANGLADMEAEFITAHSAPKSATETKDLKRAAQALAKPVFRAQRVGNMVGPDQSLAARFNDAVAGGAKQGLEDIPDFGPRIAASEGRTQDLIGATQALRKAEARRLPLWAELGSTAAGAAAGGYSGDTKKGIGTALAIRALASPRSLSRGALAADMLAPLAAQGPRLAALLAALSGTPESPE
jgi:hypothetical protein